MRPIFDFSSFQRRPKSWLAALFFGVVALTAALPRLAHARSDAGGSPVSFSTVGREPARALVKLRGTLTCPADTKPEDCSLRFQEQETGKQYLLSGKAAEALRIFKSGHRQVTVEGTVPDSGTEEGRTPEVAVSRISQTD